MWRRRVTRSRDISSRWGRGTGAVRYWYWGSMERMSRHVPPVPEGAVRGKGATGPSGLGGRASGVPPRGQVQNEDQLGESLKQVKDAGLIPVDQVRLRVVADGASWIWKHVKALFPGARQVLDYYHCAAYLHRVAKAQYGASVWALECVEATMI